MGSQHQKEKIYIQDVLKNGIIRNEPGLFIKAPRIGKFHSMPDLVIFDPIGTIHILRQLKDWVGGLRK